MAANSSPNSISLSRILLLTRPELVALSIFASYFLIIISLFILIGRSLWLKSQEPIITPSQSKRAHVFSFLALGSFGLTWYSMFAFLLWSFRDFESITYTGRAQHDLDGLTRLTAWLMNSELFEQAWSHVCSGPMNWWWSEKLCLFTVGYWTVLLATEGRRHKVPHIWAYMLLGQVVAISVAANLFYVALVLYTASPSARSPKTSQKGSEPTSLILWLSVLASLITVFLSPYTSPSTFLPNLLTMHTLIIIPLIFPLTSSNSPNPSSYRLLYTFVALASITLHTRTTISTFFSLPDSQRTLSGFARKAGQTFFEHPAQTSISWDVVCTYVSFVVWQLWASGESKEDENQHVEKKVG